MTRWGAAFLIWGCSFSPILASSPWSSVEKILGHAGTEEEGLFRIDFPRTDLNVTVQGVPLEPELALTSRFFFKPLAKGTLLSGDLVLLDLEVREVSAQLAQNGFQIISIHDFLPNESPVVKLLHVRAQGSRANLSEALKKVFLSTPLNESILEKPAEYPIHALAPVSSISPALGPITAQVRSGDWEKVQAVLGPGNLKAKVLQYEFPLGPTRRENGLKIQPSMGSETFFGFQKVHGAVAGEKGFWDFRKNDRIPGELVAAAGQFLLTQEQVGPAKEIFEKNHATIVHISEFPSMPKAFLLYFWVLGPSEEVAGGIQAVLESIKKSQ